MSAQKFASVVCAVALATGVAAAPLPPEPRAAAHAPAAAENVPTALADDATYTPAADAKDSDDAAPKKNHDPVGRVLTAPFRALARLFGGGKKRKGAGDAARAKDASKPTSVTAARADVQKRDEPKPERAQSANVVAANPTPRTAQAVAPPAPQTTASPSPAPQPLSSSSRPPSPPSKPEPTLPLPQAASPRTDAAANAPTVATPGASVAGQPKENAPFTPLVVGVAGDPLSQGRALLERGYVSEAIRELNIAAATGSNLIEANNLLGLAHDLRGLHKQAQQFYERALSVSPNDPRVLNNLGYSLYLDDRYKDALSKLKLAVRLDPSRPEIYNNLGFVYARLDKYDDAQRNFARAGGDFYARVQVANLLEAAGRDLEAIKHFEAARRIEPTSTDVLRRLVNLYNRTGQRDKAEAAERALDRPKTKAGSSSG